ncbi:MAG: hypothetical protein DLM58_01225 [Pseudonocardiales bacterium]|nr:MAG: hypothetical protein DLM58_01225 [Pseudonocardiales bacterium]
MLVVQAPKDNDDLDARIIELSSSAGPAAVAAYCRGVLDAPKLPKGTTRAKLLVLLGEFSERAGDVQAAGTAFKAAVEDGGQAAPDTRGFLAGWELEHGDVAEGRRLIAQIWDERPSDPTVYLFVGELLEERADLASAARWYTAGALRALERDRTSSGPVAALLLRRRRARLAQGLPEDDYDEISEQMRTGTYVDLDADPGP